MANYNKSFNFRNGVQVDDDNLVVDGVGKVGIGTTVPIEFLDIRGNATVSGFATASSLYAIDSRVSGVLTATTFTDGKITINSGIITASSGVVTFYGDGRGIVNIPTSQWVDTDVGLGYTSIYAAGNVGIATTDPRYALQIGGSNNLSNFVTGVGINSTGDILATGIITASTVRAALAATFLTGTIDNARIPSNISVSGIVTATTFVGNLTGTATTAQFLTGSPSITVTNIGAGIVTATNATVTGNTAVGGFVSVGSTLSTGGSLTVSGNTSVSGIVTASTVNSGVSTTGISTVYNTFHVGTSGTFFAVTSDGKVGLGSATPTSDLLIRKGDASLVEVISETGVARVSIGQSVGVGNSTGVLRFGNSFKTLDVLNRDTGNINMILHAGGSGIDTGRFDWIYGQTNAELMSLTYDGKLGLGITNPTTDLHVVGTSTVTGNSWFGGNVTVSGTLTSGSLTLPNLISANINSTSGVSTFSNIKVLNNLLVDNRIGIGTTNPIVGLDLRSEIGLLGSIGINTDSIYSGTVISAYGNAVINGGLGINTNYFDPGGATFQIHAPLTEFLNSSIKTNATVGFDTSDPKAIFAFSNVGAATTRPVMVVPNINDATITGIAQTPAGSIIFNTTTLKFQGYTGIAWTDFH